MDTQRFILFAALAFVLMLLMQSWQRYQLELNPPAVTQTDPVAADSAPEVASVDAGVPNTPEAATTNVNLQNATQGQIIRVKTDVFDAEIDTAGGTLSHVALSQYPVAQKTPELPVILFENKPVHTYLAQSGIAGNGRELPSHNTIFNAEQTRYELGDQDQLSVRLTWQAPDNVNYHKIFEFKRNSYAVDVRFEVDNQSAAPWQGNFYGQLSQNEPSKEGQRGYFSGGVPSFTGGAYYTAEEQYQKLSFKDMREADTKRETSEGWVAMLEHYFVSAWLPAGSQHDAVNSDAVTQDRSIQIYSGTNSNQGVNPVSKVGYLSLTPTRIEAGESGALGGTVFVGPKEHDRLNTKGVTGLDLTVDYGWLTVIANPLFWVLNKINNMVNNWGWSIILLTILIKLIFFPLSAASYKSMAKMKKLSPRLQTLKERYGDDKQKFQQAMMELYKTEKVNPAGGCLPILVQIPVFIALYWVLLESVELRQAPWAFWISDLSSKDPYYILPILMGASMLLQQWLNPAPMDPIQQKIMMALPVVFTIFFLSFPSGLVLYWVVNNVLSIAQQWMIQRKYQ